MNEKQGAVAGKHLQSRIRAQMGVYLWGPISTQRLIRPLACQELMAIVARLSKEPGPPSDLSGNWLDLAAV